MHSNVSNLCYVKILKIKVWIYIDLQELYSIAVIGIIRSAIMMKWKLKYFDFEHIFKVLMYNWLLIL
jgi:hypothetical protein